MEDNETSPVMCFFGITDSDAAEELIRKLKPHFPSVHRVENGVFLSEEWPKKDADRLLDEMKTALLSKDTN